MAPIVFMGSKTHLMLEMFSREERAFYQSAKLFPIRKIPREEMGNFIRKGFSIKELVYEDEMIDRILLKAENIPYYVQFLAAEIYSYCDPKQMIGFTDLEVVMEKILDRQGDYYSDLIQMISPYQQNLLRALSNDEKELYSKDVADRYLLSSASTTQRALQGLIKLGIIERMGSGYEFSDPFFKIYLAKRFFN
jgi:hypothetical protein